MNIHWCYRDEECRENMAPPRVYVFLKRWVVQVDLPLKYTGVDWPATFGVHDGKYAVVRTMRNRLWVRVDRRAVD